MIDASSSNAEKIELFRSLFVGREDVFARRYENAKKGRSGYSPYCLNQWGVGCGLKRQGKCGDCAARRFERCHPLAFARERREHEAVRHGIISDGEG